MLLPWNIFPKQSLELGAFKLKVNEKSSQNWQVNLLPHPSSLVFEARNMEGILAEIRQPGCVVEVSEKKNSWAKRAQLFH